jgi:hypothetical protein
MSCSPFDLKDYFLQELAGADRQQVEQHVRGCQACREELDQLRFTEATLLTLREEEIPQRIAFVSDKVFEPSPWKRAWSGFWGSASKLGFASAAMVSAALLVFALNRPAPAPQVVKVTTPPVTASISPAEVQRQIQTAVDQAVAVTEARLEKKMEQQSTDLLQRVRWAAVQLDMANREQLVTRRLSYNPPSRDRGDLQ